MLALYLQLIDSPEARSEFEKLYYKYRKLMYYIAFDVLQDSHLAEDVVSETFLNLAKKFSRIQEFGDIFCPKVKRYVVISVKNTALNMLKNRNRHHEVFVEEIELGEISDDVMNEIIEREDAVAVMQLIEDLSDIYREVMQLYAVCGHDVADVANILEMSKETVYKRIQRARKMLKNMLG